MNRSGRVLTVDIGNTSVKVGVFEGERLVRSVVGFSSGREAVSTMLTLNSVDGAAYCCVGDDSDDILGMMRDEFGMNVVALTPETRLPIRIEYGSRDTLGADRVAAAVGAARSDGAVLVVDAGTAVTSDIVADGVFAGGNISPGLKLRFRSLHEFTSRLPLVSPEGELDSFGHDTVTAIRAGVVNGLLSQLADDFNRASLEYDNLSMVLTGGDASFIAPMLESRGIPVVTDPETVGRGLVRIYNYNNDL